MSAQREPDLSVVNIKRLPELRSRLQGECLRSSLTLSAWPTFLSKDALTSLNQETDQQPSFPWNTRSI